MKKINFEDHRFIPNYGFSDAARYFSLPVSTIRSWALGMGGFKPVIELPPGSPPQLSFINLVEVFVLSAVRRVHRIPMPRVRKAILYAGRRLDTKYPLAELDFSTDNKDLFVDFLGKFVDITGSQGQIEMRQVVEVFVSRIQREDRLAARLFPFSCSNRGWESLRDQPRNIVIDPRISFGRPVIVGRGIPTGAIAERFKAGESIKDIADDFSCGNDIIEEAVRFEQALAA